jgi:hypothetical protein
LFSLFGIWKIQKGIENKVAEVHVFGRELFVLILIPRHFPEPRKESKQSTNSFTLFFVRLRERAKKNNTLINNILKLEIMYRLNQSQPHADYNAGVMETETIQKNGARPKSQTSRGNFLMSKFLLILQPQNKNNGK